MHVLIVEDEVKTAAYLKRGLEEQGFTADVASSGEQAIRLGAAGAYDALILDVMLPGASGWDVLGSLRASGSAAPVLFLTARGAIEDRVRGLELGADDYLVKPFAFSELLARLRTILRRSAPRHALLAAVADLEIDTERQRARRAGRLLDLTPTEFLLLGFLVRRAGEILSRRLITENVWGLDFDIESNVVDVHIRRLRAKVDEPFDRPLIHTVRGAGYVLEDRG